MSSKSANSRAIIILNNVQETNKIFFSNKSNSNNHLPWKERFYLQRQ